MIQSSASFRLHTLQPSCIPTALIGTGASHREKNVAKTSKIVRNEQRRALVAKYAAKRAALKETLRKPETSPADRKAARAQLQSLPANANPIRIRNRCEVTGRPRGYYSKFGLSRLALRELALRGELPGVVKSSW